MMKKLHNILPAWLLITLTAVVAVFFLLCLSYVWFEDRYDGLVYPGIRVAGVDVGGKNSKEAKALLDNRINSISDGITVSTGDRKKTIVPEDISLSPDLATQLIIFNSEASTRAAMNIGRSGNFVKDIIDQTQALISGKTLPFILSADRVQIIAELKRDFSDLEKESRNASIIIEANGDLNISDEENGVRLDYEAAVNSIIDHFSWGVAEPVMLATQTTYPDIKRSDIRNIEPAIARLLELKPVSLVYEEKKWKLDQGLIRGWINAVRLDGAVTAGLDPAAIAQFLKEKVEPAVGQEVEDAKLKIENGRVTVWQAGKDGRSLDREAAIQEIMKWAAGSSTNEIALTVKEIKSAVADQTAEDLGLKEIIGTGYSKFVGSPANRRHNIKVGAMALDGLLIKPGEEFSLLKALGSIDAKAGYLPELVIKENKTTPEFGGGLCQIGTTVFRATFNSGLPVTARRNHSYRVAYYEPAGTDATIYDPAPDYKFVNDTGHYILIQARMGTNDLYFDFWGTKDGREVNVGKPVIYNIVPPPPTKIIETTDLPEGKKKCTESAHAGADAYFDYSVTYPNGEKKDKRFSSHYVPWQAVCLVGAKKPLPQNPGSSTPSSTVTPSASPAL